MIYELHVDGLGLDRGAADGTLEDAMRLLDYLVDLGVNAIELMPMSEFQDRTGWGYSTSHYMAVEYSGGGRDQFKHFVRECHRRGIAVILDVVYNHYTFDSERAEWAYDSNTPENNIYYWYEGRASDYPQPDGRLHRQRLEWLGAAILGGEGTQDVHQQRRRPGQRIPFRRVPGRPDHGTASRCGGTCRWSSRQQCLHVRSEVSAGMDPDPAAAQAQYLS